MKHHIIRNNKGLSLTELLVTIGVVTILSSVAIVQYGGYEATTQKQQLLDSARLFVMKVKSCLTNLSSQLDDGWAIYRSCETVGQGGCNLVGGKKIKTMRPCQGMNKNVLKNKLGYDCPAKAGVQEQCRGYVDSPNNTQFFCLDIRKVIKGQNYQVIVHFDIDKQQGAVYCREKQGWHDVSGQCTSTPNFKSWNGLNTDCQCEWPKDSLAGTCPSSTPGNTPGNTGGNGNGGNGNTPQNPSTPEQNGNNQQQVISTD